MALFEPPTIAFWIRLHAQIKAKITLLEREMECWSCSVDDSITAPWGLSRCMVLQLIKELPWRRSVRDNWNERLDWMCLSFVRMTWLICSEIEMRWVSNHRQERKEEEEQERVESRRVACLSYAKWIMTQRIGRSVNAYCQLFFLFCIKFSLDKARQKGIQRHSKDRLISNGVPPQW